MAGTRFGEMSGGAEPPADQTQYGSDRQLRLDLLGGGHRLGGPPQLAAAAVGGEPGDPALGVPDV